MHISQLMPAYDERIRDHPLSAPAAGFRARQVKWSYVIDEDGILFRIACVQCLRTHISDGCASIVST